MVAGSVPSEFGEPSVTMTTSFSWQPQQTEHWFALPCAHGALTAPAELCARLLDSKLDPKACVYVPGDEKYWPTPNRVVAIGVDPFMKLGTVSLRFSAFSMYCRASLIFAATGGNELGLSGPSGTMICGPRIESPKRTESRALGVSGSRQTMSLMTLRAAMNFGGFALSQAPLNTT